MSPHIRAPQGSIKEMSHVRRKEKKRSKRRRQRHKTRNVDIHRGRAGNREAASIRRGGGGGRRSEGERNCTTLQHQSLAFTGSTTHDGGQDPLQQDFLSLSSITIFYLMIKLSYACTRSPPTSLSLSRTHQSAHVCGCRHFWYLRYKKPLENTKVRPP